MLADRSSAQVRLDPKPLWKILNPWKTGLAIWHFVQMLAEFPRDAVRLGWQPAIRLTLADLEHWLRRIFQRHRIEFAPTTLVQIRLSGYEFPFHFRRNTSDRFIIRQVFREQEYACIPKSQSIRRFLDGGANIGCTSFFLLSRFPNSEATVIAPDRNNMELCRFNLKPFGDRVSFQSTALWSKSVPLKVVYRQPGLGQESMTSVTECSPSETPNVHATSMDDLINVEMDLVKLDIEGAETEIFERGSHNWIERTHNLVIELHGPMACESFHRALADFDCEMSQSGELTVCQNLKRRTTESSTA